MLLAGGGGALAQDAGTNPVRGAYGFMALGSAENVSDPGFITCRCRADKTVGGKIGGGYRFGVPAVELFWIDFGNAKFGPDGLGTAADAHLSGPVIAAAWSGRFGPYVELTGRVGAAEIELSSTGQQTERKLRLLMGGTLGWRINQAITAEMSLDATGMHDAAGTPIQASLLGFGLRYKF
jgi:hypothetical protein